MTPRVLIIDDSALSLQLLQGGLSQSGFDPVGAADLASVATALESGPFAAVVVDLQMPEAFGDDVLEFLREAKGVKAPIVLYSDLEESALARRARDSGADGWATKADGVTKLATVLRSLLTKGEAPKASRRVMIVDDSEMTARLIEAELAGKGFEVILADSADKATRLILKKATRPELIMLDVNMPNVDGAHFCRFIKGNSLFRGIKVVLCSGMETEKLKAIAAECGADGIVPKDSFLSKWVLEQISADEAGKK